MTVKMVAFDIGNVLVSWTPEAFFDRVIGVERRTAFFSQVDFSAINESVDAGAPFHGTLRKAQSDHPDFADVIEIWRTRFSEMLEPVIDHSVRLLRALRRADIQVIALSNFGVETFEIAQKDFPFLEEFDQHYISGHMGVIKPDAAIYEQVEAACGVEPEAILFADDRPANISAAKARGWQTHLFEGPEGWSDCLVRHGLLSADAAK